MAWAANEVDVLLQVAPIKIAVREIMPGHEEPERYFRDGQWFSVKQGDWVDPSTEIKMDFLKKAKKVAEELEAASDTLEKVGEVAEKVGEVVETSAEILEGAEQLVENGGDLQEVVEQTVELVEEVQEVVEETQEVVEETKEILDETEEFIEKFEAVEKYRKESEHNGLAAAATGVDIVIHAAEDLVEEEQEVFEEVAAVVQEKLEELVDEEKTEVKEEKVEEKKEEAYDYRANDEETCEQVAAEDEADAEVVFFFSLFTSTFFILMQRLFLFPCFLQLLILAGLLSRERSRQRKRCCQRSRRRHQVDCQRLRLSRRRV